MRGGDDKFDDLGREVPEYEITRWTDGVDWHEGEPDEATLRAHVGDPDFMMTVHFPALGTAIEADTDWSIEKEREKGAHYNMVGGFEDWDDFEVAIVDMYTDYV